MSTHESETGTSYAFFGEIRATNVMVLCQLYPTLLLYYILVAGEL